VVLPVAVLLVFGLIIGAIGVYRHHQMALVTREAARWASVHGTDYQGATHQAAATAQDVYEQAIKPKAVDLDLSKLRTRSRAARSPSRSDINGSPRRCSRVRP
jgi:hypothetical protein